MSRTHGSVQCALSLFIVVVLCPFVSPLSSSVDSLSTIFSFQSIQLGGRGQKETMRVGWRRYKQEEQIIGCVTRDTRVSLPNREPEPDLDRKIFNSASI